MHKFELYLGDIINYASKEQTENVLQDLQDSSFFKKVADKYDEDQIILPITFNTDGAKIFAPSKTSLWPIQVTLGFLPPKIRFLNENISIVGLYCGERKPDIQTIVVPFAEEMQKLQQKGILHGIRNNYSISFPRLCFAQVIYLLVQKFKTASPRVTMSAPAANKKGYPLRTQRKIKPLYVF